MFKKLKNLTNKQKWLIAGIVLFVILSVLLVIKFLPLIKKLQEKEFQEQFQNWVSSFGIWGILVLLICQVLQIVLFFLPGEVFEFSAGLLYGVLGGYLICVVGQIISILIVYGLYSVFGNKLIKHFLTEEQITKISKNKTRAEVILFFCLLMPGINKDIFNFVAPYCKVPMWKFILITIVSRFTSVFSSILLGSSVITGNYSLSIVVLVLSAVISLLGIVFNKKIVIFLEKMSNKEQIISK